MSSAGSRSKVLGPLYPAVHVGGLARAAAVNHEHGTGQRLGVGRNAAPRVLAPDAVGRARLMLDHVIRQRPAHFFRPVLRFAFVEVVPAAAPPRLFGIERDQVAAAQRRVEQHHAVDAIRALFTVAGHDPPAPGPAQQVRLRVTLGRQPVQNAGQILDCGVGIDRERVVRRIGLRVAAQSKSDRGQSARRQRVHERVVLAAGKAEVETGLAAQVGALHEHHNMGASGRQPLAADRQFPGRPRHEEITAFHHCCSLELDCAYKHGAPKQST